MSHDLPMCNNLECAREDHLVGSLRAAGERFVTVSENDIALVESLTEATVRAGQLTLAIQGFSLTLRLRAESGLHPQRRSTDAVT